MKPKKIGTHKIDYSKTLGPGKSWGLDPENHPVYEYRSYYIVRSYSSANDPSSVHFEIYNQFENGEPKEFDFRLNSERGQKRLIDAVGNIDVYLDSKSFMNNTETGVK